MVAAICRSPCPSDPVRPCQRCPKAAPKETALPPVLPRSSRSPRRRGWNAAPRPSLWRPHHPKSDRLAELAEALGLLDTASLPPPIQAVVQAERNSPPVVTLTYMPSRSETLYAFSFSFRFLSAASVSITGPWQSKYRQPENAPLPPVKALLFRWLWKKIPSGTVLTLTVSSKLR